MSNVFDPPFYVTITYQVEIALFITIYINQDENWAVPLQQDAMHIIYMFYYNEVVTIATTFHDTVLMFIHLVSETYVYNQDTNYLGEFGQITLYNYFNRFNASYLRFIDS